MSATKFVVKCDDYTTRPYRSREVAEHEIECIARLGACTNDHEVIEVADAG